ncbi:tRNA (N6-threonylcarbamoyladenosine(37)-N6)-methyltransferase TrmO [Persicirhabdus sediminis]|uniref:tRNA (N6-threonylcarbamoyladenosine(37)-N6)-methyltransferase TrmO n=1 Tax=Persicirhabdus sediminis TaxID=454144 RepID=UPI001F02189C|nr:tRNA (N6-threonylcarbamoyladenosine(37)-N6)-methyltransferase TrmO [Persicirhabdus sediminis]
MIIDTIATLRSCYGEKFGVPRQSGLVDEAWGKLIFEPHYRNPDAVRGLEGFSHVWLIYSFHHTFNKDGSKREFQPTVRPPRLGGNEKLGVFATRSPFRPNPIGLSVVRLDRIELNSPKGPVLHLRGVDLVNGTPILDIKPYLPYADALPEASAGFAPDAPNQLEIKWECPIPKDFSSETIQLIENTLALDPRPPYQVNSANQREYGCLINGRNVRWMVQDNEIWILSI